MIPLMLGLLSLGARADDLPAVDLQRWTLPVDSRGTLWTEDASDAPSGWYSAGMTAGWQRNPLLYRSDDGQATEVIGSAFSTSLQGAYSFGRLRAGLDLPFLFAVEGADLDAPASLGDISLDVKAVALDHHAPVGLALIGRLWAPTTRGQDAIWASERARWELGVAADLDLGPVLLACNLVTRGDPSSDFGNVVLGNAFSPRLGVAWHVLAPLTLSADVVSSLRYGQPLTNKAAHPVEGLIGASVRLADAVDLRLAGGRGVTSGIGSPDRRVVMALSWSPPRSWVVDSDADGIADDTDRCPADPEDMDGYQDEDGCPELSTSVHLAAMDEDGQAVSDATISFEPGGAQGTGAVDKDLAPGDYAVHIEADGFVPLDLTLSVPNGPPISQDAAMVALPRGTLAVSAVDPQGAPVGAATWSLGGKPLPPMNGGKGSARVPVGEAKVRVSAPGFVPVDFPAMIVRDQTNTMSVTLRPAHVEVTREKLVITEKIFFDTNRATIKPVSFPLLDEIVTVLRDRTDIKLVRIEGHTDTRGSNSLNLQLSDARAASVRSYLIEQGISPDRLNAIGFGETKPLIDEENAAAWEKNRRVEFFIERWDE